MNTRTNFKIPAQPHRFSKSIGISPLSKMENSLATGVNALFRQLEIRQSSSMFFSIDNE